MPSFFIKKSIHLVLVCLCARAADDLPSAARELARKTHAPASVTYHNRSSLPESALDRVRHEFETALMGPREGAATVTLSENATQYLLIEEADSQTSIAAWNRSAPATLAVPAVTLDRKLLWEQDEPILDVASWEAGMLVLSPGRLTLYRGQSHEMVTLNAPRGWPRDPRGRLRRNGTHIEVFLPGAACQGDAGTALSVDCRPGNDPWVLESGSRALMLANFTADRNYFDGRIVLQDGSRKTVPQFYSAAAAGDVWLLALVNGQVQMFSPAWEQGISSPSSGSDIIGVTGTCANVLATAAQPEALQAFSIANRAPAPVSAPLPFSGAITALWPFPPNAALAVEHDAATRRYRAYVVTLVCSS